MSDVSMPYAVLLGALVGVAYVAMWWKTTERIMIWLGVDTQAYEATWRDDVKMLIAVAAGNLVVSLPVIIGYLSYIA